MSACPMRPQPDRAADEIHMRRAIALSRKALGWASPNPAVGCVLVREGTGVGEGWTAPYGGPHAEVAALAAAREAARGATAYVTLAPCAHHGKTPPCTAALLAAGVARVVVAVDDPDPVSRDGVAVLRQAGVSVDLGCCDAEALDVLGGFVKTIATGLPLVRLKYAMTLDGRIASRTGHSRWVSGAEARAEVHRFRAESDAVLVGVGTVLADDPRLTARDAEGALDPASGQTWQPRRVVLDSHGRTPASACVFDCPGGEAVVVTTERIPDDRWAALASCGATILPCPERDGHVDAREALVALAGLGVRTVFCEGGGTLAASLLEAGLVDELIVYVAPKIVGGAEAPGPVGGRGAERMDEALALGAPEVAAVGTDVRLRVRIGDWPSWIPARPEGDGPASTG